MDIQQWLENTADREPPDQHKDQGLPDFIQPLREPEKLTRKYRRKRKRASSDSSILELRHPRRRHASSGNYAQSDGATRSADIAAARPHSSPSFRGGEAGARQVPAKTYEKRARHKTKPDRYEPKAKKHGRERSAHDERKEKPKRRKSHRSGDGGRTTGLVQSFHLKNGPKNSRLTLKPATTAGLFKHGRASAQVDGRGGGLPDLVFNEMRFLQRPKVHQDELPEHNDELRATKNGLRTHRNEEVSAYFGADKQAPLERSADEETQALQQVHHERRNVARRQSVASAVDLPEKPFLGFGSKGHQPDSKEIEPTSHSYFTWSESVGEIESPAGINSPREEALKAPKMAKINTDEVDSVAEGHPQASRAMRSNHGTRVQSRRVTGPSLVEVYEPQKPGQGNLERRRSATKETSQSLRPDLPSEPPTRPIRRGTQGTSPRRSDSYHTSDILHVRKQSDLRTREKHARQVSEFRTRSRPDEKENEDPRPSTPTGKLLKRARQAVERSQHTHAHPAGEQHIGHFQAQVRPAGMLFLQQRDGRTRRSDELGDAAGRLSSETLERLQSSHTGLLERRLQSASGLRSDRTPGRAMLDIHYSVLSSARRAHPTSIYGRSVAMDDDKTLDQYPDNMAAAALRSGYSSAHRADTLTNESTLHRPPALHHDHTMSGSVELASSDHATSFNERQAEPMLSEAAASHMSAAMQSGVRYSSAQGQSALEDIWSEQIIAPVQNIDTAAGGEFAGFWKPNKLY